MEALIQALKAAGPSVPIVVVSAPGVHHCEQADHYLESFDPSRILGLLQKMEPEQTSAIQKQDELLSAEV